MLPELGLKILATMGVGFSVMLADAQVANGGWEDHTLKAVMAVVIGVLWKLLWDQQKIHREDMSSMHKYQKESLDKTVNDCTSTMKDLRNSTEVQTSYFRQVAQTIINSSVQHNSERKEDIDHRNRNSEP